MPRYQFACVLCDARFDAVRAREDTEPVTCPVDGSWASLRGIVADGLIPAGRDADARPYHRHDGAPSA